MSEIAAYLNENPSLQVGIDGFTGPRGAMPHDQNLSNRRVAAVRNALIEAGVPDYKIRTGAFGDARLTQVHNAILSHLRFIHKSPDRVRGYFNNAATKYAA